MGNSTRPPGQQTGAPGSVQWGRGHVRHGRVPDWVLDAEVSDRAVRLYVVLGRYADENGRAKVSKAKLVERLRCARSTLDGAFSELIKIDAIGVTVNSREDGSAAANSYALHWSPPVYPRGGPSDPSGEGSSGQSGGLASASGLDEPFESQEPMGANAPSPGPPKLVKVDGRDLAFDRLRVVCRIDPESPRLREIPAALNGPRGGSGIRDLFWVELRRWAEAHDGPVTRAALADVGMGGERFESALEQAIARKADLYRRRWPGIDLTPLALRKHWLDLEQEPEPVGAGLTAEQIEAAFK